MLAVPLGNENSGECQDRAADFLERLGEELSKPAAIELGIDLEVGGAKQTCDNLEALVVCMLACVQGVLDLRLHVGGQGYGKILSLLPRHPESASA